MKFIRTFTFAALASIATLAGCDGTREDGPKSEFDRKAMLTNYVDNLIVPGYQALKTETAQMATAITAFTANPTASTLANARSEYQEAYLAWQDVSVYEFGPAYDQMLRNSLNIYPTTTSQIESNVSAGTYDLQASVNLNAKGFPALDYLLYGAASDAALINQYSTAAQAANRKKYLQDVAGLIKQQAETTYTGWTTGNTAQNFKDSGGTGIGSAVGNLVNEFNSDIDITKRYKVGFPTGRFLDGTAMPEKVEAYYSKNSLALLERNLRAQKAIFQGMYANNNGLGLDDYLEHVAAKTGLAKAITAQYDAALAAVAAVPGPLSQALVSNPQAVTKVYDELQKLIILTKTGMPSALGVAITYNDNDGD